MAEPDRDASPGRQRRSTERSRENIREYVKLLGRKVTPKEAKMTEKTKPAGDTSLLASTKLFTKKQEMAKEMTQKKGNTTGKKSPKTMGKVMSSPSVSPKQVDATANVKDFVNISKVGTPKEKSMPVLKSVRASEIVIEPSTSRSIPKSGSTDSFLDTESDLDNLSSVEDFEKEKGEGQMSLKKQKSGRGVDCKSDSPPDLVLFLKEGRGRAQNYSEPPTLESETVATRRRTRVPSDPKSIDISKKMITLQTKAKNMKEVQKRETKREKLKVLDTPESLKRLAQGIPLKDRSKSVLTVKQETPKSSGELKPKKRTMLRSLAEKTIKQEILSSPVSDEESHDSDEGKRPRGRRRGQSSESTSSLDSQSSPRSQISEDPNKTPVGYINLDSLLQKVPDNMADEKIPLVIMADSDQDKPSKAMPKSRKNPSSTEEKEKSRAFIKLASSSSDNSPVSEDKPLISLGDEDASQTMDTSSPKTSKVESPSKKKSNRKVEQLESNKPSKEGNVSRCKTDQGSPKVKASQVTAQSHQKRGSVLSPEAKTTVHSKISLPVSGVSGVGKSSEPIKICSALSMKREGESSTKAPPLVVRVSDLLSLSVANRPLKPTIPGGKLNIRMSNLDLSSSAGMTKTTPTSRPLETFLIKGDGSNILPKTIFKIGEISGQDNVIHPPTSQSQKYPVIDFSDIDTQEVVVGDVEDSSTQSLMVGHLPDEIDLIANEELGSSSDEERDKSPDPQSNLKREALSPEGKVALDHSYSSGGSDGGKPTATPKKKTTIPCEKPMTSRPVYSSASLAKRSLDIMLHNDKINILRQMSQVFNDEKPVQPEKEQAASSSEGEADDDLKIVSDRSAAKTTDKGGNENKEEKHTKESCSKKDEHAPKLTNQKFSPKTKLAFSNNLIPSQITKKSQPSVKTNAEGSHSKNEVEEVTSKKTEPSQSTSSQNQEVNIVKEEVIRTLKLVSEEVSPTQSTSEDPKVHHVPMYSLVPDEQITVQSSVGVDGEHVDIIDGFTFVAFNSLEELNTYTEKRGGKTVKRHCPWLKRKKRKKFMRYKKKQTSTKSPSFNKGEPSKTDEMLQGNPNLYNSSAFASNDLDTYLTNNARLNISYAIPKCKTTEEGVTRLADDELLEDSKSLEPRANYPDTLPPVESHPSDTANDGRSVPTVESESFQQEPVHHHYEEVNAIDILYPKEKYKYYYNKDLCKETKADGANVFVRRAGKLVPLTSVFKSQKTSGLPTPNKKTAELVYVYDGGKLLTLGGSLTKINPSNSDSVRARVILPIGVPPIMKGDICQSKTKKVQAVEINEDLAKFALSALQNPECKDVKSLEGKDESRVELEKVELQKEEVKGKDERKQNPKEDDLKQKNKTEEGKLKRTKIDERRQKKPSEIIKARPTKTNILDIIAAKLAMDEGESDKEDSDENTPPKEEDSAESKEDTEDNKVDDPVKREEEMEELKKNEKSLKETDPSLEEITQPTHLIMHGDTTGSDSQLKVENNSDLDELCGKETVEIINTSKDANIVEEKENLECKNFNTNDCVEVEGSHLDKNSQVKCSTNEKSESTQKIKSMPENKVDELVPEEIKTEIASDGAESQSIEKTSEDTKTENQGTIMEEPDNKTRTFKKNMYRFPSLSREMKRLNMNFVNYTVEEPTAEENLDAESEPKDACTREHCVLGCVCDTLSCRRRDPEHCGRVECMFECKCRDESWKHAVSGVGRTMNAVSIFNLDREQKEGLALREKDFKKTVIQTGSEVILVGAERKKRERRIPGRYRDSAVWMGGDLVDMDCTTHVSEPEVPPEPEYPSIPLSEAHKYIKKCKITVPWYDVKGISVWCMDHSCYDCKCLKEPNFYTGDPEEQVTVGKRSASASTSADSIEEVLKQEANVGLGILSPHHELDGEMWDGRCVVVNIHVNNTEAKRKYSWKLKEWYHPRDVHSARTIGYTKKNVVEETKHLTLTGLSSQESTPEQIVENVVRSLKDPRTKLFVPALGDFPKIPTVVPQVIESPDAKAAVPLVDLTSASLSGEAVSMLEQKTKKQSELQHVTESVLHRESLPRRPRKRSMGALDMSISPNVEGSLPVKKAFIQEKKEAEGIANKDEQGLETKKSDSQGGHKPEKFPYRKPVSLLEMMIAEEKRGELELDLSNNFPGNAMLVAESRFRKLINMNIIGVIGINKSGRCIIATVDSIDSMRVMQRIHSMISNNSLDVGPNMREIFFPPPHTLSRPRFVMIRCDGNAKWEIVGVVQKKGPFVSSKSGEAKSKQVPKPGPSIPQVVDLEEEERQKKKAKEKPDVVILADSETNEEDGEEKEGGDWEGSLPLIASVHSASDVNMADFMDLKDAAFSTAEEDPLGEVLSPKSQEEEPSQETQKVTGEMDNPQSPQKINPVTLKDSMPETSSAISASRKVKALPDLVPIKVPSTEGSLPENTNISISNSKHGMALTNLPSNTVSPVSLSKMKTIKLNQSSSRIFGDSTVVTSSSSVQSSQIVTTTTTFTSSHDVKHSPRSPPFGESPTVTTSSPRIQSPRCSSQILITSSTSTPQSVKASVYSSSSHTGASTTATDSSATVSAREEKIVPAPSFKKVASPPPSSTMIRPPAQVAQSRVKGTPLLQGLMPSSAGGPRMMYIPVSSSNVPKMVLMPSGSSGPTTRMVLMSTSSKMPTANVIPDSGKMKMVIVPSTSERNKMVIHPTREGGVPLMATSESDQKLILLPPSQAVNFVESKSIPEVNLVENVEVSKKENVPEATTDTKVKEADSDDSDDVVVIGTSSNTLTIKRVKGSTDSGVSEPVVTSTAPSLVIMPSTKPVVSGSGNAQTTVVSSVSTITSTLPQIAQSQTQDCDNVDSSGDRLNSSEDMVIVKTSLYESQLNALLQNTHKDMLKNTDQNQDLQSKTSPDKKDSLENNPEKKETSTSVKGNSKSNSLQSDISKVSEIEEVHRNPVPIKKIGHHWSAVDLSLPFKSVKLEWLHGTIRKNVLVNIFRMSQKTQSPVTLSVKNGSSASMLYGLARRGLSEKKQPFLVLVLGSIISAVLSSSSTPDNLLFQGNAVKYFIREPTGELSSYTYDTCGEYLVKLASKKRGNGGEMIGIGEKVLLQKMRELSHSSENLLVQSSEKGSHLKKVQENTKRGTDGSEASVGCSCTASGDFICHGHSTPDTAPVNKQEVTHMPQITEVKSLNSESKDIKPFHSKVEEDNCSVDTKYQALDTEIATSDPSSQEKTEASQSKEDQSQEDKVCSTDIACVKDVSDVDLESENVQNSSQEQKPRVIDIDENEDVDIEEVEQGSSILLTLREQVAAEAGTVDRGRLGTPGEVAKRLFSVSRAPMPSGVKRKADFPDHHYERPCPRSKKKLMQHKIVSSSPRAEVDFTTSLPQDLSAQQRTIFREAAENEPCPGPSGVKTLVKAKSSISVTQQKTKNKDAIRAQKKFSESDCSGEERSAVVHNELERIRRRVMKKLFSKLQHLATYNTRHYPDPMPMPKVAILSIATKVCKEVRDEETQLTNQEEEVRTERSKLIKRLASFIADQGDEVKKYWKQWVRSNMKYPVSRIVFEKNWKPSETDKDLLNISSTESSLDMDLDDGSPLSAPSSPHSTGDSLYAALTSKSTQPIQVRKPKIGRPGRKPGRKVKKKVNPSQKLMLDGLLHGLNVNSEAASSIPTSILLMAGTSSRGRKIVRKEDINFVPS